MVSPLSFLRPGQPCDASVVWLAWVETGKVALQVCPKISNVISVSSMPHGSSVAVCLQLKQRETRRTFAYAASVLRSLQLFRLQDQACPLLSLRPPSWRPTAKSLQPLLRHSGLDHLACCVGFYVFYPSPTCSSALSCLQLVCYYSA